MRVPNENIPLPPAHRIREIGERVQYGAHQQSTVKAVSECKRFYTLKIVNNKRKSYGTEDVWVEEEQTVMWTNLLKPFDKDDQNEMFCNPEYYPLSYQQRDINALISKCLNEYGGVDFEPEYQRELVWRMEDKVALIDSILAKRDIGKFVFNHRPWSDDGALEEIIDGKQRLTAIFEFYTDQYKYKGLYYSELHYMDRMTFKNKPVSCAMLEEATYEEILETFIAVNTTGKPQDVDHLNKVKAELENRKEKANV